MLKQSQMLIPTLREVPSDAEIASHKLLLRAGMARQLASGIYTYLPLALRTLQKIQAIVREEMNRAGGQELLMPAMQPAELWHQTGRWDVYGPELVRLKDRHDRSFALGPTHEEVITSLVRDEINSYKKLPINLYQIQTKFRDEVRPRFGLIRSREFIMKDAYSFDTTQEGLDKNFQAMYDAYTRIFTRVGLNFRAVEADAGAIGGKGTYEFMALCDIGEDTIAYSENGDYAANLEKAEVVYKPAAKPKGDTPAVEKVHTPDVKTIEQLTQALDVEASRIIKSLVYRVDEKLVMVLVRGDHEINEVKLKNLYDATHVGLASEQDILAAIGTPVGFVGPVGVDQEKLEIIADNFVQDVADGVAGANEKDYHLVHVQAGRDFTVSRYADLRNIMEGDECPRGGGLIKFARGVEVGHVFKLGTKYSTAIGATYLDENGRSQPMIMGCYGIGVSRTLAAAIEQNNDEHGIIWPVSIAPFHVHVIPVNAKVEAQRLISEEITEALEAAGVEVLYDDRPERAGVKFKDADLIGLPLRITVSDKASEEGLVEVRVRRTGETHEVKRTELVSFVKSLLARVDSTGAELF
ncbi:MULTISPECIES: proline--tRNA ligase [Brevibacillus]|uniref:proline--tRNA ligase n=2 Tax=Brevibacillus TaxID=55080 RepID=UPI000468B001|nr:proline--tRNA ligase [Brevibacillus borstelensis]MED1746402.1 proline--tRNA ligase [Brevibacillus borstelensis]MED1872386.1 proline--tRNA ligase [Brevibacillus borstelensis]MED1881128.1 proline--tRNA ligase [Brevibacillus borstelensis]RNB66344.1 proline--tRNA ligase [Brevibacillus borstelensis]GED53473.1 proline--tRNA ligase 1 [Brevibacillus borstelensis]